MIHGTYRWIEHVACTNIGDERERERERDGLEAFFLLGDLALAFGTC